MLSIILSISIIKEAVFYPVGAALIKEEKEIYLKKGYNIVELTFLPVVSENSFKIEFSKGEIISISVERKVYPKLKGKFKTLQDSLDFLRRKIDSLQITKENLKKAKEFLESFKVSYSEKESKEFLVKKFEPENIKKALKLIINQGSEIEYKINKIEEQIKGLKWKENKIVEKINDLSPIGKEDLILKIHLNSQIEGKTNLNITYLLSNKAGFDIIYRIKGEPEKEKVKIEQSARVYQVTGQNFRNIKLALSTYKIRKEIKPYIEKWLIRQSRPVLRKGEIVEEIRIKSGAPAIGLTRKPRAEARELYTSFYYEFPYKVTLPSSKEGRIFHVKTYELPAEFEYEIIPKTEKIAFLKARTYIKTKEPLLEGEINLFLGNEFIGKDYNYGYNPGDTVTFYFGEDPFIKVEHELIKSEVKKGRIFDSKKVIRKYGYKTIIKNNRKNKIRGILIEQIPVSNNPEIQVKGIKFTKKPFKEDKTKGFYYFRFELNPDKEYSIEYYFDIISPKDVVIEGL